MGRFDSGPPLMKTEYPEGALDRALGLHDGYMLSDREEEQMKAERIRSELDGLSKIIEGLETDLAAARKDRAELVRAANADPAISMTEAARLAGLSRVAAYEALKKR